MKSRLPFFDQFVVAVKSYLKALSFVTSNGLWIYFIYPVIISILLIAFGYTLVTSFSDTFENRIIDLLHIDRIEATLLSFLHFFIRIGINIIFFFVYLTFNKYVLLILMSPAMASLSEKTEHIIRGTTYSFDALQFAKDIFRGICIALRNMLIEFGFLFLCFIVVWIPVIGWFCPIFLFILSCYFYGFSMIDYTSERRKMNIPKSIQYIRQNKGLAIGNGFVFTLLFAVPFIGASASAILAPVAATIAVLETE